MWTRMEAAIRQVAFLLMKLIVLWFKFQGSFLQWTQLTIRLPWFRVMASRLIGDKPLPKTNGDPALSVTLRWRHNEQDSVTNHQPRDCLLNPLFGRRSKQTSKLRVTDLCVGNSPGTGEFPAQKASYAENFSIWWRHHGPSSSASPVGNLLEMEH